MTDQIKLDQIHFITSPLVLTVSRKYFVLCEKILLCLWLTSEIDDGRTKGDNNYSFKWS